MAEEVRASHKRTTEGAQFEVMRICTESTGSLTLLGRAGGREGVRAEVEVNEHT